MSQFTLFVLLGVGAGAAYAILGISVVAVYKGSGILNFGQGAMAMFAAFSYAQLCQSGIPKGFAAVITVLAAALVGALLFLVVIKRLRRAPALAKAVMSIGLLSVLVGLASRFWSNTFLTAPSILPTNPVHALGASFGANNLWAAGIAAVLAFALWALYRFTTFGMLTRAASENESGVALLGYSPDLIGAGGWALGGVTAAIAGIMIAPISGLDINNLTFLIVPALAAALLGAFRSFGLTATVGVVIGIAQSEINRYWTQAGVAEAVPFIVVIGAMAATGRLIPARGMLGLERPPYAPRTRVSAVKFGIAGIAMVVVLGVASDTYLTAITNSMIVAIFAMSLVIVTGFLGQISLAQMAFAGCGAFTAARFSSSAGIPFPWPVLVAAVFGAVLGVIIGLPALRVRGLSLAVMTLGFADALYATVFSNSNFEDSSGVPTRAPKLGGFSLDPITHPMRFAVMVLIVLGLMAFLVMNLRRSALGQRMLAVRSNERSAAAAGINVTAVKLGGFALAAAIAAVGGALGAYQIGSASDGEFTALASITLVTIAFIGGIASVSGALIAGWIAAGGVFFTLLSGVTASLTSYFTLVTGLGLMLTAIMQPDGAAVANMLAWKRLRDRIKNPAGGSPVPLVPGRDRSFGLDHERVGHGGS